MNPSFAIAGRIQQIDHPGDLPMIELSNQYGRAVICLQGAHVIEYQPNDQPAVLWLSDTSHFEVGKAIRGGIPICWPWFGDHPQDPTLPAHGLARTRQWQVLESTDDGETTSLRLGLTDDDSTRKIWPYRFRLELLVQLGARLCLTLTSHNPNDRPMPITEALHSYLAVSDIGQVNIAGLTDCRYRDKLDNLNLHTQANGLAITGETDRVYLDTQARVSVEDPGLSRQIRIVKSPDPKDSLTTVVWNPWQQRAHALSDFDDEGYKTMVCVETANALDNALEILPGQSHSLTVRIETMPL